MKYACIALIGLLCMACSHKPAEQAAVYNLQKRVIGGSAAFQIPKASAFRMSGDYADKVGVTLNPDGTLAYFPAPTDITSQTPPVALGDGWWLNRQGISANSVFTKWTFDEYSSLEAVPSPEEIIAAVIPGAVVTEIVTLPLDIHEAFADPSRCALYLPR